MTTYIALRIIQFIVYVLAVYYLSQQEIIYTRRENKLLATMQKQLAYIAIVMASVSFGMCVLSGMDNQRVIMQIDALLRISICTLIVNVVFSKLKIY